MHTFKTTLKVLLAQKLMILIYVVWLCLMMFGLSWTLITGLYGSGAMALSNWIQRNAPIVATINPTQQVTNLFYDILYYDSYAPFFRTVGILLTMAVLALSLATVFLRRQRYAHL